MSREQTPRDRTRHQPTFRPDDAVAIRRRPDGSIDTAAHARDGQRIRSRWWRALARRLADACAVRRRPHVSRNAIRRPNRLPFRLLPFRLLR